MKCQVFPHLFPLPLHVPHLHAVRHEVSKKKARKKFVLWATTRVVVDVAVLAEMSHQLKKAGLGDTARAC